MKTTIISNCCGGADVYIRKGARFTNPFVWSEVFERDLLALIENLKTVDFYNFDLTRKNKTVMGIVVDNRFTIWFPHYKYDPTCETPVKRGVDVFYKRNYEYVVDKYVSRCHRMSSEYEPYFLIFAYKDKVADAASCKVLQDALVRSGYSSLLITPYDIKGTLNNKVIIEPTMLLDPAPTPGVYVEKYGLPRMFTDL